MYRVILPSPSPGLLFLILNLANDIGGIRTWKMICRVTHITRLLGLEDGSMRLADVVRLLRTLSPRSQFGISI